MIKFIFILFIVFLLSTPAFPQVTAADISWDFECGSLQSAATLAPNDINLTLRLDDQWGDLYGWYYFRINQNAAGQMVAFHILNRDGWMNENHKPVYSYDGEAWFRIQDTYMASGDFHFSQHFTVDNVQIALVFPYSYTDLLADLDYLSASPHCEYEFIGQSVHGRDIPLVTISDARYPDSEKRACWMTSRQHPMETPPSFTIQALMEYLVGWGMPGGEELLRYLIFKIVPMVNVDGVAEGLSSHNVNGINLNRCWCSDSTYAGEEPEVEAVHRAMDEWIAAGNRVDFYIDMHAAPDLYDFGFRLSQAYTYESYYCDITSYIKHLDASDPFQSWIQWRDLDENYGTGISFMALYNQHGTAGASSEHSWSRRWNGIYITIPGLLAEGPMYGRSLFQYLHPLKFTDAYGSPRDTLTLESEVYITVNDPDEDENSSLTESVLVTLHAETTGDIENLLLTETGNSTGLFRNPVGLPIANQPPTRYNCRLEAAPGARICAVYQDDDFALDSSWVYANISSPQRVEPRIVVNQSALNISVYPNPFNERAVIGFSLPYRTELSLRVYDVTGRLCRTLSGVHHETGSQYITFDAENLASGIYFVRLIEPGGGSEAVKIVVEK